MRSRRLVVLGCFSLLLAGCPHHVKTVVVNGQEVPYEEAAKQAFDAAETVYNAKDFKTALEKYEAFVRDFAKSSLVDEAIFRIGSIHEADGDVPGAGRAFQKIVADYPDSDFAGEARFHLGVAYWHAERFNEAEQILKAYEKRPRDPARTANAQALIAEALEKQNKLTESALYRLRAAKGIDDPVLAQWQRERALDLLAKETDPGAIQPIVDEVGDQDPFAPRLQLLLAEAKYAARDYAGASALATALTQKVTSGSLADEAKAILQRAAAREKVDPHAIGVVVPLSGDFQAYGQKALQAVFLAAGVFGPEVPNAPKLKVAVRDSGGDPAKAAQAVDELFEEEGIVGIIGPLLSNETEAAGPRAQALGVPLITLAQKKGLTDAGNFVFRDSLTAPAQAAAIAAHAFDKLGAKRYAIMYPQTAYGQEMAFLFWDEVEARGGEVVGVEHYDSKENDFTNEVDDLVGRSDSFIPARRDEWEKIKYQAHQEELKTHKKPKDLHLSPVVDFDAVFVPDDYKKVGQLLPFFALSDVPIGGYTTRVKDMHPVIPLGTNGWNNPELIARGGRYVEGACFVDAFYPDSPNPDVKAFVEKFVGVFLRVPDVLDALAYDTTAAMADRIKSGASSREKLRDELDGMKGFKGVTGLTGFDKTRDATRDLTVLTVQDKEIKPWTGLPNATPTPAP